MRLLRIIRDIAAFYRANRTTADADAAMIDATVARCLANGNGPGVTMTISAAKGYIYRRYGSGTGNEGHYRSQP
jgi:hypothetical protein